MPVVRFEIAELERLLRKPVPRDELASLIPMLGADVDDVSGDTWAIEFFPDRPDLYTVEGIARALRAYLGVEPGLRQYEVQPGKHEVTVEKGVADVRPHIGAAFVRGVEMTQARLDAIIDLQEDLHWGLGARRRRVAIGIHDAGVLKPPFRYLATPLDAPSFVPLQETATMTPQEVLTKHPKGVEYAHLLKGHERVPLILDAAGGVVSLPPVINAARTTVTTSTRDLFVDVTGTDEWAVERALNIIVTMLAEAGGHIEQVTVVGADGTRRAMPDLKPERRDLSLDETNRLLGTSFTGAEVVERLEKMGHGASAGSKTIEVSVPAYRADVLHAWDLIEDVAIGHGVNNFDHMETKAPTTGAALPQNKESERARQSLIGLGFLETLSLTLSNDRDQFTRMQREPIDVVRVKNPVTEDHTMLRPALLPSLLNILKKNAHRDLPQRLFEVGMTTRLVEGKAHYERHVAGVIIAGRSSFSEVKSAVLALARDMSWPADISPTEDAAFVPGRIAEVAEHGVFGEIHPATLEAFGLSHPVTAFELRLTGGPTEDVQGATD